MEITNSLEKLGLTSNETAVYLFLLQNGSALADTIIKSLGLDKASTYRALKSLVANKLIASSGATRNQIFFIESTDRLQKLIVTKESELIQVKDSFNELLNDLEANKERLYKEQNIETFQGKDGYLLWNERRLNGKHTMIRELGARIFLEEIITEKKYQEYMSDFITRRVNKGINMRYLMDINEKHDRFDVTDPSMLKESRQFPTSLDLSAFLTIFGDHFGYYSLKNGKFMGVIVLDPLLARLLTSIYDVLWAQSKPISTKD